jgi:UDP-N-acetyl-D-mannosaminuronic acid dehydrogenase
VLERARRFRNPVVAVLGLAYKADIDDLRESPALHIARRLAAELPDGKILAVEPHVHEVPGLALRPLADAAREADIVVCLVAHRAFREMDRSLLAGRVVIDPCGGLR